MGLEPISISGCGDRELGKIEKSGGAESGALGARATHFDAGLAKIIHAWPALPQGVKERILATVQAATSGADG